MADTTHITSLTTYLDAIFAAEVVEQLPDDRWRCTIPVLIGWTVDDDEKWRCRSHVEKQVVAWVARHRLRGESLPALGALQPVITDVVVPDVLTARLRLVPFTATLVAAAVYDHVTLARLLGAQVHPDWPYPWIISASETSDDALVDESDESDESDETEDDELLWEYGDQYTFDTQCEPEKAPWMWMIIDAQDNTLIGRIGAYDPTGADGGISLLYSLVPEYQGRGYMTEAAHAYVTWAFTHPELMWIYAMTKFKNVRSRRVLEKLGARIYADDRDARSESVESKESEDAENEDTDKIDEDEYRWLYWELLPDNFARTTETTEPPRLREGQDAGPQRGSCGP